MRETCLVDKRCVHYNEAQQCPNAIDCRNEKISELQAELDKHRWIPVVERLPETTGAYQVIRKINDYPSTRMYNVHNKDWRSNDIVTHWKPIILPKGGNDE